jgi:hypothetical protein
MDRASVRCDMFACSSEYMRKLPVLLCLLWARQFSGIGVELNNAEVFT